MRKNKQWYTSKGIKLNKHGCKVMNDLVAEMNSDECEVLPVKTCKALGRETGKGITNLNLLFKKYGTLNPR